jgi:type II secretory pathway pseudopilin PulG
MIKGKKAKSFVTIMIVIAVLALILRIVIERVIDINITQNESNAQGIIKLISAALENYAKDNQGIYPTNLSLLTATQPPYLDKDDVTESPTKGYNFNCPRLETSGYSCTASPLRCKLSGKTIYTITTAGVLISQECEKKE